MLQRELSYHLHSRQHYSRSEISSYHWINGYPPPDQDYQELVKRQFEGYRLQVSGMVEKPLSLSLEDLRRIGYESQIVKHNYIQGWSGVASGQEFRSLSSSSTAAHSGRLATSCSGALTTRPRRSRRRVE